jgi:uncharacterized membrane protein YdfJ with MMPL/SSD domain
VIFGILGAPCAVTTLIGPLAVALGVGAVFGLSGVLTYLDQSPWRVPVLIVATLGALANLYTLWHARKIREEQELVGMTRLEKRRTAIVLGTAILTIFMVIFEVIAHAIYHS